MSEDSFTAAGGWVIPIRAYYDAFEEQSNGVLVIPQRFATGLDGVALAAEFEAELLRSLSPSESVSDLPLVVVTDRDGHIICDCLPYVETGRCEHWHRIGK